MRRRLDIAGGGCMVVIDYFPFANRALIAEGSAASDNRPTGPAGLVDGSSWAEG